MPETETSFSSGAIRLAATLTVPATPPPWPVVLTIHGTGPLDRDQNTKNQRLDIFNAIAAALAPRGIATLRYDKRGCGKSGGDYYTAGQTELIADAAAGLAWLRADKRFARFFLLGHSEGTLIAPQVAQTPDRIDGLILLAPFIDNGADLMRRQAARLDRTMRARRDLKGLLFRVSSAVTGGPIKTVERVIRRTLSGTEPSFRVGFSRWPAKSGRELIRTDPRTVHEATSVPTLLVSGAKDIQCDPGDAEHIANLIGPDAHGLRIDELTHLLRRDPGRHNFLSYPRLLAKPVDADVLRLIGDWLAERGAS